MPTTGSLGWKMNISEPGDYNIGSSIGTGNDFSAAVTLNGETQQITLGSLNVIDHTADTGKINGRFKFETRDFQITHGVFKLFY